MYPSRYSGAVVEPQEQGRPWVHAFRLQPSHTGPQSLERNNKTQRRYLIDNSLRGQSNRGLIRLRDITPPEPVNFRSTCANNGLTANQKLSRLVGFFSFWIQNGWLTQSSDEGEASNGSLDSYRMVSEIRIPAGCRCHISVWRLGQGRRSAPR